MRIHRRWVSSLAALLVLGLSALPLWAQGRSAPVGTNVAVVDISKVFEHHQRFQAAIADIKKDVKGFEGTIKSQRDQATKLAEQLQALDPTSADYRQKEAQGAQMMADMQVQQGLKRKEFMEREAKLYYQAYTEVTERIQDFATRHNIGLVLRYSSEEIDASDRNSVIQGVNRPVVYQDRLDITREIIDELNRGTAPANIGRGPQIPRRR